MATLMFKPATKSKAKLRMALFGPSGAGKTFTALKIATSMGKTALIDTERGSASKYATDFSFDVVELQTFSPQNFIDGIHAAAEAGYEVLVIDSLSHAWNAAGGILEMVDKAAKRSQSGNSFAAWRDVTPLHNALIDAILTSPLHIIVTMRSKTEYVMETNEKGKQVPRKVGLAPIQREGMEYEFDVCGEMDWDNNLSITKTRCTKLNNEVISKPGRDVAKILTDWLTDGAEPPHWALNGGGERIATLLRDKKLSWDQVKNSIEPSKELAKLSDTSLEEWQVEARIKEIAGG